MRAGKWNETGITRLAGSLSAKLRPTKAALVTPSSYVSGYKGTHCFELVHAPGVDTPAFVQTKAGGITKTASSPVARGIDRFSSWPF